MLRLLLALSIGLGSGGAAFAGTLYDAASAGNVGEVERLLAAGEIVDTREPDSATPLTAAALAGQAAIAETLIQHGADVMARNKGGFTPLHAAAWSGSPPVAVLLLEKGAALDDAANKAGVTPLLVAAEENHVAMAELLIAKGADLTHRERQNYTALSRAFFKGNTEMIRLLKSRGVSCQPATVIGGEVSYQQCVEAGK